jgi:hypothetical protein
MADRLAWRSGHLFREFSEAPERSTQEQRIAVLAGLENREQREERREKRKETESRGKTAQTREQRITGQERGATVIIPKVSPK